MKTTAYFRDVVHQKHPGIEEAWILRVLAQPLEERLQADGRFSLSQSSKPSLLAEK